MKVLIYKNDTVLNITNLLTEYSYTQSIEQSISSFSFSIVNSPYDLEFSKEIPNINCGDIVALMTGDDYYDLHNYTVFFGRVYEISHQSNNGANSYFCYDFLNNLQKSNTYQTYTDTAENITKNILCKFGYGYRYLENTGINLGTLVYQDETYLNIIRDVYERAGKVNNKKYHIYIENTKVAVWENGKTLVPFMLEDNVNIISASSKENIEDIVNQVNVYDENNKFIKKYTNQESIQKYGLFEQNYTLSSKNDITGAESLLKNSKKEITMQVVGEINLWAGRQVMVKDRGTGLIGKYLITNTKHQWTSNSYITELNLEFMGVN